VKNQAGRDNGNELINDYLIVVDSRIFKFYDKFSCAETVVLYKPLIEMFKQKLKKTHNAKVSHLIPLNNIQNNVKAWLVVSYTAPVMT